MSELASSGIRIATFPEIIDGPQIINGPQISNDFYGDPQPILCATFATEVNSSNAGRTSGATVASY